MNIFHLLVSFLQETSINFLAIAKNNTKISSAVSKTQLNGCKLFYMFFHKCCCLLTYLHVKRIYAYISEVCFSKNSKSIPEIPMNEILLYIATKHQPLKKVKVTIQNFWTRIGNSEKKGFPEMQPSNANNFKNIGTLSIREIV